MGLCWNFLVGSAKPFYFCKSDVSTIQGHPVDFGAKKRVGLCYFLLDRSYLAPFRIYCRFLCSWPHPYSTLILWVFPLHQIAHVGWARAEALSYRPIRPWNFEVFQRMKKIPQRHGQTDRQIDGQTTLPVYHKQHGLIDRLNCHLPGSQSII